MNLVFAIATLLGNQIAYAADPPVVKEIDPVAMNPCPFGTTDLSCANDLPEYIRGIFIGNGIIYDAFSLVVFVMVVFYGVRLIILSRNESAQADAAMSYANALVGIVLVAGAAFIANVVLDHSQVVNTAALDPLENSVFVNVYNFIKAIVVGFVITNLFIQGFRLVATFDDGNSDSAKQALIRSLAGAAIVLICSPIVYALEPRNSGTRADASGIVVQIAGIANFLLTIFGALAVLGFVTAGILFVVSVEDSLRERAQKLMIASIVSLIIVIASTALIRIFIMP